MQRLQQLETPWAVGKSAADVTAAGVTPSHVDLVDLVAMARLQALETPWRTLVTVQHFDSDMRVSGAVEQAHDSAGVHLSSPVGESGHASDGDAVQAVAADAAASRGAPAVTPAVLANMARLRAQEVPWRMLAAAQEMDVAGGVGRGAREVSALPLVSCTSAAVSAAVWPDYTRVAHPLSLSQRCVMQRLQAMETPWAVSAPAASAASAQWPPYLKSVTTPEQLATMARLQAMEAPWGVLTAANGTATSSADDC